MTTNSEPMHDWHAADRAHHLHPFTDNKALAAAGGARFIDHAKGVYLYDADGNDFIDGLAGLWNVAIGYGRGELADAAAAQMRKLSYYNTFFQTTNAPLAELSGLLAQMTPDGIDYFFYSSSGSEANDTIIKLARRFWALHGRPERRVVISREYAYHGSTWLGASAGGMAAMHDLAGVGSHFEHVLPPYHFAYGRSMSEADFGAFAAKALEDKILEIGPEYVALVMAEPIQAAGGVIVPPDSYFPLVQDICRKYEVLLCVDEVVTGFGRTGHWFGCETFDLQPDFMTLAKAITSGYFPLSAAGVSGEIAEVLNSKGGRLAHGYTNSGHPVGCAVALENLRILREEKIVERAAKETGPYLQARLRERFGEHPLVGEVRGLGSIAAVEIVRDRRDLMPFDPMGSGGLLCLKHCLAEGLIVRAVRDSMCFCPPLTITTDEIDEMLDRFSRALDKTAEELSG
ncbi:aminotransferase class III-fold pyridoxal phosphate-dependent enzyme [bacterium]|nr:aminotransferase class III-fold pyridoxal phosphate-dependent enzyme [bacterium]